MTATIYVMDGCHYCEDLKSRLTGAGIPYNATQTDPGCGFRSTPGTYVNGKCYGFPDYNVDGQYNQIKEAYSATTAPPAPSTPAAPKITTAAVSTTTTPPASPVFSNEITIKWGGIQTGYAAKTYSDATDEAVIPTPPEQPVGMTIALRERSKVIKKES